jgi:hypothetical protein
MGIENKTPGMLIDELFSTDQKCWLEQDKIMNSNLSIEERSTAATNAQKLNKRRNALIQAIDRVLGFDEFSPTGKTY